MEHNFNHSESNPVDRPSVSNILIRYMGRAVYLDLETITLMEGSSNYSIIYTSKGEKFLICKTLKDIMTRLDDHFVRIHKSFIINIRHVIGYSKDYRTLQMSCGNRAFVSKRNVKNIKDGPYLTC